MASKAVNLRAEVYMPAAFSPEPSGMIMIVSSELFLRPKIASLKLL
jgi:hypothetical protein